MGIYSFRIPHVEESGGHPRRKNTPERQRKQEQEGEVEQPYPENSDLSHQLRLDCRVYDASNCGELLGKKQKEKQTKKPHLFKSKSSDFNERSKLVWEQSLTGL